MSETYEYYQALKNKLNFHNYRYHVLDQPIISDFEFDQMMIKLRKIEADHPEWVTPESPTQRAGAPPTDGFMKVQHPSPILSLGNAFNENDVQSWQERIAKVDERVLKATYAVEPKIDGLSVVLTYQNGVFVQGATRGDGDIGENITANLRTIKSLPLRIPIDYPSDNLNLPGEGIIVPETIVVRGEAFIRISEFEKFNQTLAISGEKTYVNPRNTAAGALRNLDPNLTATRPLTILIYQIVAFDSVDGSINQPESQIGTISYLRSLGFPVPESKFCENLDQVFTVYHQWAKHRDELDYEIDGMVIKINEHQLFNELGIVGKDPRGAIAFKFPAQEVTTKLIDIRVNVGRTGVLTPYAVLDPVKVGGVIVKQATLHNFDYIFEKDIRIGDRVRIKRAGDVIPYVIGPVADFRSGNEMIFKPPEICPACDQPVEKIEGEVAWYCVNAGCPAQLIRNVEHFVSRGAMDIVGLGIKIVEQLVSEGFIHDVADLYTLQKDSLLDLEGFAEKKADNLIKAIEESRTRSLNRLLTALGIRGVGEALSADLVRYYSTIDALARADAEELQAIEGIGPNIAEAIVDWFGNPENQKLIEKLRKSGVWPESQTEVISIGKPSLNGLTFVVTGSLRRHSRNEIKEVIESHGGRLTGSVSTKTNFLLVGENPGSKFSKAQAIGVPVINENEFLQMIENS